MANLKAIRKRIASVKNTQKITRAMKLVSAAKLRRAQKAMLDLRPYARKHREMLQSLAAQVGGDGDGAAHPLLETRDDVKTVAVFALSSDRGMCGGFNSGINKRLKAKLDSLRGQRGRVFSLGRRAALFSGKLEGIESNDLGEIIAAANDDGIREITSTLVDAFTSGDVDEVWILSNRFQSAIAQVPSLELLLPVTPESEASEDADSASADLIYEPGKEALLGFVVPRYVEVQVRQAILESIAGEHAARMNAMNSATDNAAEMIARLTLEMNRARQATITTELMEIIGGAEAMN